MRSRQRAGLGPVVVVVAGATTARARRGLASSTTSRAVSVGPQLVGQRPTTRGRSRLRSVQMFDPPEALAEHLDRRRATGGAGATRCARSDVLPEPLGPSTTQRSPARDRPSRCRRAGRARRASSPTPLQAQRGGHTRSCAAIGQLEQVRPAGRQRRPHRVADVARLLDQRRRRRPSTGPAPTKSTGGLVEVHADEAAGARPSRPSCPAGSS